MDESNILIDQSTNKPLQTKFRDKIKRFDESNLQIQTNYALKNQAINYKKNYMHCLNCNKKGHNHKNCRFPTNSYGPIIYKKSQKDQIIRYLMIQKKYTPFYIELLRAKYTEKFVINFEYMVSLIKHIPLTERNYIIKYDFDHLWNNLWRWVGTTEQMQCIFVEYEYCKQIFDLLKNGSNFLEKGFMNFYSLFDQYPTIIMEPDWEFPKGRRCEGESDQQCAIRECYEETTLEANDYKIFFHVKPFQEKFTGINQIKYCNSYYLAELTNLKKNIYYDPTHYEQNKEIRKIAWFTANEIRKLVNPEYKHRLRMLSDIEKLISK